MKYFIITVVACSPILFFQGFGQSGGSTIDTLQNCNVGNKLFNDFKFEQALKELGSCYQNSGKPIKYLEKIAFCNYKLGRFNDAKSNYMEILNKDAENLRALNQLAIIYTKEGNYNKSIELYKKLLSIDTANSVYYKQIAFLFLNLEKTEEAINYFEQAYEINSRDIAVIAGLSDLYLLTGGTERAEKLLFKGLLIDNTNIKLLMTQSKIAYRKKDYQAAINTLNQLLKLRRDTTLYQKKLLGVSNFRLENFDTAIALLEDVGKNEDDPELTHYYLGMAFRAVGNHESSIHHFKKAIDSGISVNVPAYYVNLAMIYEDQKNYEESIRAYREAYRTSRNKVLLYHLARNYDVYYKDKKPALQYYQKYLATNDTIHDEYIDYSEYRIAELKKAIHFEVDTLE